MRIAAIDYNDITNGEKICVSLWFQGCPHRCKGCHNPEQWNPDGGVEVDRNKLINQIKTAITKNNIMRNFSLLGGEPLAPYNVQNAIEITKEIRKAFPHITIYCWTGYTAEKLTEEQKEILSFVDVLIDGRYEEDLKDITLPLRGSSNQRIIYTNQTCFRGRNSNE